MDRRSSIFLRHARQDTWIPASPASENYVAKQAYVLYILDVILMTNIILELLDFNNQADINEDQIIDILDIILLINIILF